nr:zinc ribbon domain-containing protein [Clostridium algidicarnis]
MKNRRNREFLLRKLIKCKYCGRTFYGITYPTRNDVYVCAGKRTEMINTKCINVNVNADMIEDHIWSGCVDILKNYNIHIEELRRIENNKENDSENDIVKLNKLLLDKNLEKTNILTLFRKGIISEKDVTDQINDIKKEETKINKLLSMLNNKIDSKKRESELVESMNSKIEYYKTKLEELTEKEKRKIIELLVKGVTVGYTIAGGKKVVNIEVTYNLVKLETHMDMDLNFL